MKTVFKKGMKVYDQLNFPDKEGIVVVISKEKYDCYPVGVSFENQICNRYFTFDGRFRKALIPTLSTKPYKIELQGFEQKEPAPTYEEAWEEAEKIYEPKSEYNKEEYGGYPTQELADASEALRRLLFLRDYYNEGWQPDWTDGEVKYNIQIYRYGDLEAFDSIRDYRMIFTFKTEKIRDKFLEEQRELLEIAKPLL